MHYFQGSREHRPPPGGLLGVLYAWMNGYSTLLHNIEPGKYIVIKVEYGLQLHFKIYFLTKQVEKTTTKIIIKMLMTLNFKKLSL